MAVMKTRRRKADRWVQFACGHKGYVATVDGLDWATAKCPVCGKPKVVSMQGPAALENLFRF